jgi:hypothetical protein
MYNTFSILKRLGLYNPDRYCTVSPFAKVEEKEVRSKKPSVHVEQKIYGGQAFVPSEDGEVRKNFKGNYIYDKEVTDVDEFFFNEYNDLAVVENRNQLAWDKYCEVKTMWAKDYSAAMAADSYKNSKPRNGYGYGERTLDNYWSVFNKAHSFINKNNGE